MRILDDPVLSHYPDKQLKTVAEHSVTDRTIIPDLLQAADENSYLSQRNNISIDKDVEIEDNSKMNPATQRYKSNEESSIMMSQSMMNNNNSTMMDTSLVLNSSVLAIKCKMT